MGCLLTQEGRQQVAVPEEALLGAAGEGAVLLAALILQLSRALLRQRQVRRGREVQALAGVAGVQRLPQQADVPAVRTLPDQCCCPRSMLHFLSSMAPFSTVLG